MTLDELKPGQECQVKEVKVDGVVGQRLCDMGFIPGTRIKVIRNAPLVDPVDLLLKGYHVSIRHSEAKGVEVILL
ncbi:ferrous iron transport protein A [bacterium]|nr:ferrous iron transport protein A [bacterium]